jgi:transcriptional regulator with XRE-family HTH domain
VAALTRAPAQPKFAKSERQRPHVRGVTTELTSNQSAEIVGQRIRRLREQHGRTLREQAREMGISASSLSDIENSRGGISLRRLQRVAAYFELRLTDLLSEPEGPDGSPASVEIVRGSPASVPAVQRGKGVLYQVLGRPQGHTIQPCLLTFEPRGTFEEDMIAHPGEEVAYVLFGEIELLFGDEIHRLSQGDLVRFRTETPHAYRNASTVGMAAVLGVGTPPW